MSILYSVGALVSAGLLWLFLRWQRVKQYWADRGVPHQAPHPILGSLNFMQKVNASIWFRDIYKELKTPYLGLWFFWKPALLINSPELARNILVKDSANFRNRHVSSGANDPIGSLNIFTLNDPDWSNIRRRLTSSFSASKLRGMQSYVQDKSKEFLKRIAMENYNCKDIRSLYADFTTDVIGTSAFGVESNATLTGEGPLRWVTKEFMKYSIHRGLSMCCIFFWPELVNTFGFTFFPKNTTDLFKKIYKKIVSQRQSMAEGTHHKDLLDSLIKIQKESAEEGEAYSEEFIIAQAAILLQGGFDTTAVLLTYINHELAFNQEVQDKLYLELLEAKEKNGSDNFDTAFLAELPYLNCIIKEGLRKYPGMGWMDRIATRDYKVDDKLTVAAGTPVLVNSIGLHYDPEYFPDPFKFDPDRFLPENETKIKQFTYLPFGDGPRICIGQKFAQMTMSHAMAAIYLNYKTLPLPDTPTPLELQCEKKSVFIVPAETINLTFVPRM